MLVLNQVSKSYEYTTVLNKINLSIRPGEVVGLVGNNGCGKSTLFKIIAGEISPDDGSVDTYGESVGYLPQSPNFGDLTVGEFIKDSHVVGLENIDLHKKCHELSGGQKTRLYLASVLLNKPTPTVLLLDEPTNNLDLEAMDWLEKFIADFKGTVLLTSHDRFFLDRVVHKIVELKEGEIKTYGGNYSFYKEQKQLELEALQKMYSVQQKKIKRIEADIQEYKHKALSGEIKYTSRSPYNKKKAAKAARTGIVRERKLEKMLESEEFIKKPLLRKKFGVSISGSSPQGKMILEAFNVGKSFGGKQVFQNISFSLHGNERLWVVGKNGSGKTTLLKIALGLVFPDEGQLKVGTGIKIGYFSQESRLDPALKGIDALLETGADATTCYITSARLHLSEDDLRKKIELLSYGQMAKLSFAKLLLSENNLLVLDEPTNHLEIETREDIENALQDYHGAILVASHDRYFMESIGVDGMVEL